MVNFLPVVQKAILIVTDNHFSNQCSDVVGYTNKLKEVLKKQNPGVKLVSYSGKLGLSGIDPEFADIGLDDSNKTTIRNSIINSSLLFDECIIISRSPNHVILAGVAEAVTELNRPLLSYSYVCKGDVVA